MWLIKSLDFFSVYSSVNLEASCSKGSQMSDPQRCMLTGLLHGCKTGKHEDLQGVAGASASTAAAALP